MGGMLLEILKNLPRLLCQWVPTILKYLFFAIPLILKITFAYFKARIEYLKLKIEELKLKRQVKNESEKENE